MASATSNIQSGSMSPQPEVRAGVYSTVEAADKAVAGLLAAGFTRDQVTVICSDKHKEQHFKSFEHQDPAGAHTVEAAAVGGSIGAALGGLTAIAGGIATGGIGFLVAGGLALWGGGVVGSLVGAMTTRGVEKELANFYDQSVLNGRILVAAEAHGDSATTRLSAAERVLKEAGSDAFPLNEG